MHKRMEMRAAVVTAPGRATIETVSAPEPGEGQVRVRLEGCGVCGSNLPPWEGRPWFQYPLPPGGLGHEGWGWIDALGPNVPRFAVGQRVAALSYHAYAEFDLANADALVPLPAALDDQPFPGEALGCAMNVFRRCDVQSGQTVAVVGVGFLGAVLTALCAHAGARVIAISRRPFALEKARGAGAEVTLPLGETPALVDQVRALTAGQGCDRVIEAVGHQRTLDLAAELTRERGRLIIAGYHQDGPRHVNMQLWNWRGLDVINAHERDPRVYVEGMRLAVEAIASGRLDPSPCYTHHFRLEQFPAALDAVRERPANFLKAWITP